MLDNMAKLCVTFKEVSILSFKVTVFTYAPATYKGESTSFSTSPPTFVTVFSIAILVVVKLYLNTAFICISLMTDDVESMLLAVHMSLVKCLFKYFARLKKVDSLIEL